MGLSSSAEKYYYSYGHIRGIAENYIEKRQLIDSGASGWEYIVEEIADFDTAIEALGLARKFKQTLYYEDRYLGSRDIKNIRDYLNGGMK